MKIFFYLLLFAFAYANPLQSQIVRGPNKSVEGLRTGFWVQQWFCSQIDSAGEYHLAYYHDNPLQVSAEGFYEKSEQVGFWKEYWIEFDYDTRRFKRGTIKSLVEYKNGVRDGLFFEFYPNGNLRAMGTNESYPVNPESNTVSIPDYDSKEIKMKDTTIHITHRSRIAGNGFYFAENSSSSLKFRKLNAD